MGCAPNNVPMVFIVFSWDSWGHKYPLHRTYIWVSCRGTVRKFFLITQSVLHADRENQHITIDVERMEGIFMSLAVISSSIKSRNFL